MEILKTYSILIVEDNPGDLRVIKEYFKDLSADYYEIIDCSTLAAAAVLIKECKFDAVLLDLGLPDSSGLDSLKAIREISSEIPVIVMTINKNDENGLESIKHGAQDFLIKDQLRSDSLKRSLKYAIERKNLEYNLNNSLKLFEETFEQAAVGFSHVSLDGKYLKVNRKFAEMLGLEKEEIINKHIQDITHPDDLEKDLRLFHELVKGKINNYNLEKRYIRKDSSIIWVSLTRTGITYNKKDYYYLFTTIEDITGRKKAEIDLKSSVNEKELLIKESHHRIKNNLQLVSSLLSISMQNANDNGAKDLLIDSQNRIRSISTLHEYLYRSTALNDVNIQDYLYNFFDHLRASLSTDSHHIRIIKNINSFIVKSDLAVSLGLIANELVTNAIKYAFIGRENGIIVIDIKKENDFILFKVKDDGSGMDKKIDFKNAETLGLQIIYSLVMQHNGSMECNVNNGTEFCIKFKIS